MGSKIPQSKKVRGFDDTILGPLDDKFGKGKKTQVEKLRARKKREERVPRNAKEREKAEAGEWAYGTFRWTAKFAADLKKWSDAEKISMTKFIVAACTDYARRKKLNAKAADRGRQS